MVVLGGGGDSVGGSVPPVGRGGGGSVPSAGRDGGGSVPSTARDGAGSVPPTGSDGGGSEAPGGKDDGGSDAPGGEDVATIGPTPCTSQLQSQPHSTGSCSPACPSAAVRSATAPLGLPGSLVCFGLFFLLRLLPV